MAISLIITVLPGKLLHVCVFANSPTQTEVFGADSKHLLPSVPLRADKRCRCALCETTPPTASPTRLSCPPARPLSPDWPRQMLITAAPTGEQLGPGCTQVMSNQKHEDSLIKVGFTCGLLQRAIKRGCHPRTSACQQFASLASRGTLAPR